MMGPYLCDSAIFSPCACFRVAAFALVSISFKDIKGATLSYPQEVPGGIPFFFLRFFFFFLQIWSVRSGFSPGKSEIRTLFPGFDVQIPSNGSENGWKERNTGRRITVLLSHDIWTGYLPRAEEREFASAGLQKYVWTSFLYHFTDGDVFGFSFRDFFLHFPPNPYGIRVFQWNVRRYDRVIFMIFVGILWDWRNFVMEMKTGCVGRFLMQTLLYRLTSKRKHLPLPKNAVKENGFIFAFSISLLFSFFYISIIQIVSFTNRKSQSPPTKIGEKEALIFRFLTFLFYCISKSHKALATL